MKYMINGLGFLLILFLMAAANTNNAAGLSEDLENISGCELINSLSVWGANNISISCMYPWSGLPDSSSRLKLDPYEKYMILVVKVYDTKDDDK